MRCVRCVMDDAADPAITFDAEGRCSYCTDALARMPFEYFPNEEGAKRLDAMLERIKADGAGKKYDCMMGISGGLDSSYLAYLGYTWGLRILAVHIDDGFDTEISKSNIEKLCKAAQIDLVTVRPDATQYAALTRAYMKAGVPNIAIPQDNILFAELLRTMAQNDLRYFLAGGNFATECLLQRSHSHDIYDTVNLRDIFKHCGEGSIDRLPLISEWERRAYARHGMRTLYPLNYVDYNRDRAFEELNAFCGFAYYGRKHLENTFTAFLQLYWLPKRFGVDKRTSHLSSMIVSGQMTREAALAELAEPFYTPAELENMLREVKAAFSLTDEAFDAIMAAPPKEHTAYRTSFHNAFNRNVRPLLRPLKRALQRLLHGKRA